MKYPKTAILAWVVCGVLIVGTLYRAISQTGTRAAPENILQWIAFFGSLLIPVSSAIVGALIISNQPRNVIGWLVMLPATVTILSAWVVSNVTSVATPPENPPFTFLLAVWASNAGWLLLIFPVLFIMLLFPTGRPPSPRWRPVVWFGIGMIVFFLVFGSLSKDLRPDPDTYGVNWAIPNPIGFMDEELVNAIFFPWWVLALVSFMLLSVASLVVRYRHAGTVEREQIKWVFYAAALFGVVYGVLALFQGEAQGTLRDVFDVALSFSVLAFPVAIGISILRYRLFDIDIIIRRTLTYALVTALLLVVFFGSVIFLQQVFAGLTGSGQNEIVTVLSTLAIAALFVPLRNWVQNAIDRRFNRKKYDAQQILNDFATTVRDETDLEKLTARLMQVVDETVQPKSVSLWLKRETGREETGEQADR